MQIIAGRTHVHVIKENGEKSTQPALNMPEMPCQKIQHLPSLNTLFTASSKRGFLTRLFRTSSSDILTASCLLDLSVPTLYTSLFTVTLRRTYAV